uniref:Chromo domain-containing protein n=1 Tax=Peronospora matthiolae TaxID=2874970 RepID=A0AAV1US66_9STRA
MSQVILQLFRHTIKLPNIKLIRASSRIRFSRRQHILLVDSGGGQRFLVERILNHRDVNGVRTSYIVYWRGYPSAWDSWEHRSRMIVDVLGLVEQYDETHQLRLKKCRRKTTSPNVSTRIAKCQSFRPSQKRCAPSIREH